MDPQASSVPVRVCWIILRKEDNTMNYRRPEIVTLGSAYDVIQITPKKDGEPGDPVGTKNAPAYDLDE